jgi:hypothetical protein
MIKDNCRSVINILSRLQIYFYSDTKVNGIKADNSNNSVPVWDTSEMMNYFIQVVNF